MAYVFGNVRNSVSGDIRSENRFANRHIMLEDFLNGFCFEIDPKETDLLGSGMLRKHDDGIPAIACCNTSPGNWPDNVQDYVIGQGCRLRDATFGNSDFPDLA